MKIICFDLEGPLATQDNAFELMKLFPGGADIFQAISRYDDLITLENRNDYEPGDTLSLIAPFLVYHEVREQNISELAEKAYLVKGAIELIEHLNKQKWEIFCISTSYEQYALPVTARLGISNQNVACTVFPLDKFSGQINKSDFFKLEKFESMYFSAKSKDDKWIKEKFDNLFYELLPQTTLGTVLKQVKPIGGQRKVEALERFVSITGEPLTNLVVIGDSITDYKMLNTINKAGGLAIAFNANEYALPYATMSLASTYLSDLLPVLEAWHSGKRTAVKQLIKKKEKLQGSEERDHFCWLLNKKDISAQLNVHKKIRRIVREDAASLG